MDWRGVVPLTANCSRQANEKKDMSECRGCINIALRTGKQGDSTYCCSSKWASSMWEMWDNVLKICFTDYVEFFIQRSVLTYKN